MIAQRRICVVWASGGAENVDLTDTTDDQLIDPIHPGEILMEDFIEGIEITQNNLAVTIGVPSRRISEIVHGKRGSTADTAIRLARYFGMSEEFRMNLQTSYELRMQRRVLGSTVDSIESLQRKFSEFRPCSRTSALRIQEAIGVRINVGALGRLKVV